ncbi:hypothetical protein H2248_005902 [Termitomyces sp. 'cryptogamus']|nr:hypothetical protein H2248_005902 [Termitomyces sp. 'cryptogamus']
MRLRDLHGCMQINPLQVRPWIVFVKLHKLDMSVDTLCPKRNYILSAFSAVLTVTSSAIEIRVSPSILAIDSGSKLGFYAAILDGQRVGVEPLCRSIDLIANWKGLHARHEVAATLDALVETVRLLEERYTLLKSTSRAI